MVGAVGLVDQWWVMEPSLLPHIGARDLSSSTNYQHITSLLCHPLTNIIKDYNLKPLALGGISQEQKFHIWGSQSPPDTTLFFNI